MIKHPNFIATSEEMNVLREHLNTDDALRARYETLRAQREERLAEVLLTEEFANSVYSQHGNYYAIGEQLERMVNVLPVLYLLENDREAAVKMRDTMLHVAAFEVWTGPQNKDRDVPWHSDLSTTRIAVALAQGYDMIYDMLTPSERNTIADAILNKGVMPLLADWVLPETRIHALDSMGHNWWAVCIALAGVALLPISDHLPTDTFDSLIAQIEEALIGFLTYPGDTLFNKVPNFDEKGLFYESVGYFNYGAGELLRYIWHAERYLGRREALRTVLPPMMGEAILSFAYPRTDKDATRVSFLNYGDSAYDANIMALVRYLRLLGYDSPALTAYAARVDRGESLLTLLNTPAIETGNGLDFLPKTAIYPNSGYAITRDSWENDATLFAVKSGYTWNHAHADAGSFVLYDRGRPLLIDSGSCPYGDPAYMTYFCRDLSHNVLLIDGQGQRAEELVRGNKFPGKLSESYEGDGFLYVQADATGPMSSVCSRVYRNFLWLEHEILIVADDVLCHEEHNVQFLLHFNGTHTLPESADVPICIENDKSAVLCYTFAPTDELVSEVQGSASARVAKSWESGSGMANGSKLPVYLSLSTVKPSRAHTLLHVFVLNDAATRVKVERLTQSERVGVRLTDGTRVREVWFNQRADGRRMHINSNHMLGDLETDAYILMQEELTKGESRVFMVRGSYLRRGECVFHTSFEKQTKEILIKKG